MSEIQQEDLDLDSNQEEQGPSEVEQKAIDMGWKGKDSFEGDESEFIDAAEFVRRKPLFDKIESQSRQMKDIKKALDALKIHHDKVKDTEYKRALDALKIQKKQALVDGDADQLLQVEDAIDEIRSAQQKEQQEQKTTPEIHPDFVKWVNGNHWYTTDTEMRDTADALGIAYRNSHPDADPNEILRVVEQKIKKTYPEKFINPKRSNPSTVEGGSNNTPTRKTKESFTLSDEERQIMRSFERQGLFDAKYTKEMYLEEVKSTRGAQ